MSPSACHHSCNIYHLFLVLLEWWSRIATFEGLVRWWWCLGLPYVLITWICWMKLLLKSTDQQSSRKNLCCQNHFSLLMRGIILFETAKIDINPVAKTHFIVLLSTWTSLWICHVTQKGACCYVTGKLLTTLCSRWVNPCQVIQGSAVFGMLHPHETGCNGHMPVHWNCDME